jgi:integrase/recombinase XerD
MSEFARLGCTSTAAHWLLRSPLSRWTEIYVRRLQSNGYAVGTLKSYVEAVAHFAHWISQRQTDLSSLDETLVNHFLDRHLRICHCAKRCQRVRYTVRAALRRLLEVLRAEGYLDAERSSDPLFISTELRGFDAYLSDVRGLTPITRYQCALRVRRFLLEYFESGPIIVRKLDRRDIVRFLARYTLRWSPQSKPAMYGSLRSYFRFKALQGEHTDDLMTAFPRIANWRLARIPRVSDNTEIRKFLTAFDRRCAAGRRNYAIARCLVDLALRAQEVARLTLDDFDWRDGTVRIRGKGQRSDLMPLPVQTGRAIMEYLHAGRPSSSPHRMLFARHRAPLCVPVTACMVRKIVRDAAVRQGLATLIHGPHLLRHTAAQRLLRGGATLKGVADFLRHRSLDTSTLYTKIDLRNLERVAMPWPRRHS